MTDVLLRGGRIVDGTGAASILADVMVEGDRIAAVGPPGTLGQQAARVVDASGKVVTPGFVDVHTHYDAQVFWDGTLSPSPLHGVTTALAGNCGFGIAPLSGDRADGEYLMRMLARVEGIPLESLEEGVPWDWRSTGEYFAQVEPRLGINAGFMVGHSAIRRAVMGPAAVQRESTAAELAAMTALLHEGLDAGGLGFSTTWSRGHNDADGNMVPSRHGSREEMVELARATGAHEGTSLEINPKLGPLEPWTVELMTDLSVAAGRTINWNLLVVTARNLGLGLEQLAADDFARARGGRIVALTVPMTVPLRLSFRSGFVYDSMPSWEPVMGLAHQEKVAVFRDRDERRRLDAAAQDPANPMRHVARWAQLTIHDVVAPENDQYVGATVGEIAAAEGDDPFDVLCEIVLRDDLRTGLVMTPRPDTVDDWRARASVWRDPRALVGGSDAGAHLDMMSTANYATQMLAAAREHSLMSLEEAVHLVTQVPADLYGLRDRGVVREGWKADLVVLDPATVGTAPVRMRYDLPAGAGRLVADAVGVEHVFVNGVAIVRQGRLTDDRPGVLLRSGHDTRTAAPGER